LQKAANVANLLTRKPIKMLGKNMVDTPCQLKAPRYLRWNKVGY